MTDNQLQDEIDGYTRSVATTKRMIAATDQQLADLHRHVTQLEAVRRAYVLQLAEEEQELRRLTEGRERDRVSER